MGIIKVRFVMSYLYVAVAVVKSLMSIDCAC